MGDQYPVVKVAAVQAASVFLDREGSTAKACRLIREAGANGARVIGFPEGFIPAHPVWYHHHPATSTIANRLATELFKNSVEIPGPEIELLCASAREANAYVVIGVCEKLPHTIGTMFNTQVYIGPGGALLGKHQKIMPTVGERLVHMGGFGDTFGAFQTEFGPMSALICGENSNPLAIFALTAENTRIHVMSWPNHFPTSGDPLRNRVTIDAQAFAQMSKAFVISACGTVDEAMIARLEVGPEAAKFLRDPDSCGGSVIVAPNSRVLAGPIGCGGGDNLRGVQSRAGRADQAQARFRGALQPAGHLPAPDQPQRTAYLHGSGRARTGGARGPGAGTIRKAASLSFDGGG